MYEAWTKLDRKTPEQPFYLLLTLNKFHISFGGLK